MIKYVFCVVLLAFWGLAFGADNINQALKTTSISAAVSGAASSASSPQHVKESAVDIHLVLNLSITLFALIFMFVSIGIVLERQLKGTVSSVVDGMNSLKK